MTKYSLLAAAMAATVGLATEAAARGPAPLVPIALVEDVQSKSAGVEFMDYVGSGQIIKLEPRDVLVLSYLKSCAHETITGGTVVIGPDKSEVQGGKITRSKVQCNGGNIRLSSQQANASGASSFRLQSAAFDPTIYGLPPVVQVPRLRPTDPRTLVVERQNKPGERFEVPIDEQLAAGGFLDLASANKTLVRGGIYTASIGNRKILFKVDAKAKVAKKSGKLPVVTRLLRFPPG